MVKSLKTFALICSMVCQIAVLAGTTQAATPVGNQADIRARFLDLAERSRSHQKECKAFGKEVEKMGAFKPGASGSPNGIPLVQAVQLLKKYPGLPVETHQASEILIKADTKTLQYDWIADGLLRMDVCEKIAFHTLVDRVMDQYANTRKESKDLKSFVKVVFFHLRRELSRPSPLLITTLNLKTLERLHTLDWLDLPPKALIRLTTTVRTMDEFFENEQALEKISKTHHPDTSSSEKLAALSQEYQTGESLRQGALEVIRLIDRQP